MGTAFARRYRFDLFFRTETNIILLQTGFVLFVLALVVAVIAFAYETISHNLALGIAQILTNGSTATTTSVAVHVHYLRDQNILGIGAAIVAVTAIFGYLVARMTLTPTRTALVAQKQFVGNVAHELRTPLSILKTNTEVALLESSIDSRVKKMLHSNIEELDRISDTINNLVSMSSFLRPEKIEFVDVDLGKTLTHVLHVLTPLAEHKGITLAVRKSEYRIVRGNAAALDQIVANIVKNAVHYTSRGGRVSITIEPDYRGSMDIVVEDTGIGIEQKDLERIFEPFYRADYSRNRAAGGSGLGLAIVSELVKLHQGKIAIRSTPGKGTTVCVSLPCGSITHEGENLKDVSDIAEVAVDFTRAK